MGAPRIVSCSLVVAALAVAAYGLFATGGDSRLDGSSRLRENPGDVHVQRDLGLHVVDDRQSVKVARSVRIIDEGGVVVGGARVDAWSEAGPLAVAVESPGSVSVPGEQCVLSVQAPGFLPYVAALPDAKADIEVVMRYPRQVALLVVGPDGPATGVRVRLRSANEREMVAVDSDFARQWCEASPVTRSGILIDTGFNVGPRWSAQRVEAKTDESGRVVRDVSVAAVVIEIAGRRTPTSPQLDFERSGSWSVSQPLAVGRQGASVVVHLNPGAFVRGRVEVGESARGRAVLRHDLQGGNGVVIQDFEQERDLRADGSFEFRDVIPGTKSVVVTARTGPDEVEFAFASFVVEQGDLDLGTLVPGAGRLDVELGVVDGESRLPLEAPDVRWDLVVGASSHQGPNLAEGLRGFSPRARVSIRGLPPGRVDVGAALAAGSVLPPDFVMCDERGLRCEQDVESHGFARLEGRAFRLVATELWSRGVAVGGLAQGELIDMESGRRVSFSLECDDGGPGAVVKLPQVARSYRYHVRSELGETGALSVGEVAIAGGERVNFTLVPSAAACLRIQGADGNARAVRLELSGGDDVRMIRTDAAGRAVLRGLTPGAEYKLGVTDERLNRFPIGAEGGDGRLRFEAAEAGRVVELGLIVIRD